MIDLNNAFFHGLRGHDIIDVDRKSLERLQWILKNGAILSRERQIQINGKSLDSFSMWREEDATFKGKEKTNYNGNSFISICVKDDMTPGYNNGYELYAKTGISIILSQDLLKFIEYRTNIGMSKEYQIVDFIPSIYFIGIGIPYYYSVEETIKYYDNSISKENIEDRLRQDYQIASKIRELLAIYGYNLPIISVITGEEIPSIDEILHKSHKQPCK